MHCFDTRYAWQPIATAPELERVMVCGWQPRHGRGGGYWWYHEDAVAGGLAIDHPDARYWAPIVLPAWPLPEALMEASQPHGCTSAYLAMMGDLEGRN